MKTKSLILIALAAIITLSFSFAANSRTQKITVKEAVTSIDHTANEPVGGFIAEDKF